MNVIEEVRDVVRLHMREIHTILDSISCSLEWIRELTEYSLNRTL